MTITLERPDTPAATGARPPMEPWQAETIAYANSLPALRPAPPMTSGDKRYALPHPGTGKAATWVRMSSLPDIIDDDYAIVAWEKRLLIEGLLAHSDLAVHYRGIRNAVDLVTLDGGPIGIVHALEGHPCTGWAATEAAGIDTATDDGIRKLLSTAKKAQNWIATTAIWLAGGDVKADVGTAFHTIAEHADAGRPVETGPWTPGLTAYQEACAREGITMIPGASEPVLLNLRLGAAGRADRFVTVAGRDLPVVFDIKTGAWLSEVDWAIQLSGYARADYVWTPDGYVPMPPVDLATGIIAKVDLVEGTCQMHGIDLSDTCDDEGNPVGGWARALAADRARAARRGAKKLLVPLSPAKPLPVSSGPKAVEVAGYPSPAEVEAAIKAIPEIDPADVDCRTDAAIAADAAMAAKNAEASGGPAPAAPGEGAAVPPAAAPDGAAPSPSRSDWLLGRFQALAHVDGAQQWMGRNWPAGVPTAPPWTDDQVDALNPVLEHLEMLAEDAAPFPPSDPAAPPPDPVALHRERAARNGEEVPEPAPAPEPDPAALPYPQEHIEHATDDQLAAIAAAAAAFDDERTATAIRWRDDGTAANRPWNAPRQRLTTRQAQIILAASACLTHLWDAGDPLEDTAKRRHDQDILTRLALTMVLTETDPPTPLHPTWTVGAVLGSLTTPQAQRLAQIAEAFTASNHPDADELGRRYLDALASDQEGPTP